MWEVGRGRPSAPYTLILFSRRTPEGTLDGFSPLPVLAGCLDCLVGFCASFPGNRSARHGLTGASFEGTAFFIEAIALGLFLYGRALCASICKMQPRKCTEQEEIGCSLLYPKAVEEWEPYVHTAEMCNRQMGGYSADFKMGGYSAEIIRRAAPSWPLRLDV